MSKIEAIAARITSLSIVWFARFITAIRGTWIGIEPSPRQRVYFANHTSNGDFILLWAALPSFVRRYTRPVAGSDYWLTTRLKTFIGTSVFNTVLIDRNPETRTDDPVDIMVKALDENSSLIIFPEGLRNMTDTPVLPFKTGLFHLATKRPEVEMVPVWIENLNRMLPKGEIIPIPFGCTVTFGPPIKLQEGEDKQTFLNRAADAIRALIPDNDEKGHGDE